VAVFERRFRNTLFQSTLFKKGYIAR